MCLCVHVFAYVSACILYLCVSSPHTHAHRHMRAHTHMHVRTHTFVHWRPGDNPGIIPHSTLVSVCYLFWRHVLSHPWNRLSRPHCWLVSSRDLFTSASPVLGWQSWYSTALRLFSHGFWGPVSGCHACRPSTVLTEPSLYYLLAETHFSPSKPSCAPFLQALPFSSPLKLKAKFSLILYVHMCVYAWARMLNLFNVACM